MTAPTDLIERLEGASVGSRELDFAVAKASGSEVREGWAEFYADGDFGGSVKSYTTSLDAALALAERVLPDHAMNVCKDQGPPEGPQFLWSSVVARHSLEGPVGRPGWWFGVSDTPAIALCIAILKALRASEQSK